MVAGDQERGPGQQIGPLAHPAKGGVEVLQLVPFGAQGRTPSAPLFSFVGVPLGS